MMFRMYSKKIIVLMIIFSLNFSSCKNELIDWWWRLLTNHYSWKVEDNTYCNGSYGFCVTNTPRWFVDFPQRFWKPFDILARFVVFRDKVENDSKVEADVFLPPPDMLELRKYEMTTPIEYLTIFLRHQKQSVKNFKMLQEPIKTTIDGKESARAIFELTDSNGEAVKAEPYVFLHQKRAYVLIYSATSGSFETHHNSGLKIIESFRFPSGNGIKD